jgi:hypothetical protein
MFQSAAAAVRLPLDALQLCHHAVRRAAPALREVAGRMVRCHFADEIGRT